MGMLGCSYTIYIYITSVFWVLYFAFYVFWVSLISFFGCGIISINLKTIETRKKWRKIERLGKQSHIEEWECRLQGGGSMCQQQTHFTTAIKVIVADRCLCLVANYKNCGLQIRQICLSVVLLLILVIEFLIINLKFSGSIYFFR